MKRFEWRLQRVLEIRRKEEQTKRAELFELTEKLAATRGELLVKQKILRNIVCSLAGQHPKGRLVEQEFFMAYSATSDEQIKRLKEKISQLESQQKEKITEVMKVRRFKEGLEKLRAEAKTRFIKEQEKIEQKELDEGATILFVRNARNQEKASD